MLNTLYSQLDLISDVSQGPVLDQNYYGRSATSVNCNLLPPFARLMSPGQSQYETRDETLLAAGYMSTPMLFYTHELSKGLLESPFAGNMAPNGTVSFGGNLNACNQNNLLYGALDQPGVDVMETKPDKPNARDDEKCLCKRSRSKIPRPRNAFILFRQRYHREVLLELHEMKSNPEVSKELGRRWRALPASEKEHWNTMAKQEKEDHARRYPNYKYAPRKNRSLRNCQVCRNKKAVIKPVDQYMSRPALEVEIHMTTRSPHANLQELAIPCEALQALAYPSQGGVQPRYLRLGDATFLQRYWGNSGHAPQWFLDTLSEVASTLLFTLPDQSSSLGFELPDQTLLQHGAPHAHRLLLPAPQTVYPSRAVCQNQAYLQSQPFTYKTTYNCDSAQATYQSLCSSTTQSAITVGSNTGSDCRSSVTS